MYDTFIKESFRVHAILIMILCGLLCCTIILLCLKNKGNKTTQSFGTKDVSLIKTKNEVYLELMHAVKYALSDPNMKKRCMALMNLFPEAINKPRLPVGYTPFLKACFHGCDEVIIQMLKKGADINSCIVTGDGPFFLAVNAVIRNKSKDFSILKCLIDSGCSVNKVKNNGYSVLHLGAHSGQSQLVRWLLLNGADPNTKYAKISPFNMAKKCGHEDTAALLYINLGEANSDSNDKNNKTQP